MNQTTPKFGVACRLSLVPIKSLFYLTCFLFLNCLLAAWALSLCMHMLSVYCSSEFLATSDFFVFSTFHTVLADKSKLWSLWIFPFFVQARSSFLHEERNYLRAVLKCHVLCFSVLTLFSQQIVHVSTKMLRRQKIIQRAATLFFPALPPSQLKPFIVIAPSSSSAVYWMTSMLRLPKIVQRAPTISSPFCLHLNPNLWL